MTRNGDTWQKFTIDMAKAANRPASAGALDQGAISKVWTFPVGFGWIEVSFATIEIGPVSFPLPNGMAFGKEKEDLPGADTPCTGCLVQGARPGRVADLLLSINQTFYVRVVPVDGGGRIAGNPSLPVEVTVERPDRPPTLGFTTTHVLRPPSVRIVSYDPIRESAEPYHYYVLNGSTFWPKGAHFYNPPDESTCDAPYVTDSDCWIQAADAIADAVEAVTGALATTWQMLQDFVVEVAIKTSILGPLGCGESDACRGFLKTTLQVVMVVYGVPPTLAELRGA